MSHKEGGATWQPWDLWAPRMDMRGYQRFSGANTWPGARAPTSLRLDPDGWLVRLRVRSRHRNQRKLGCSEQASRVIVRNVVRVQENPQKQRRCVPTWPEPS